jgi:hypothetical protein
MLTFFKKSSFFDSIIIATSLFGDNWNAGSITTTVSGGTHCRLSLGTEYRGFRLLHRLVGLPACDVYHGYPE